MELTARLARDVDEAYAGVIEELQHGVFSTALQLVRNRHDAEDLTQETFVRVYRALTGFTPARIRDMSLKSYVWTTLINLSRNRARYARRHPEFPADGEEIPSRIETTEAPEDWVEAEQIWRPRLAQLSERQRMAVLLRHVAGLSYAEVAETLEVPVGTAKADVHRGLERLRTMIEAEGAVA
ncbi:MAG: RNA polymerase sigma factor [Acidimicrobiia bacterium]